MAPARDAPPSGERRPDVILDVVFEQGLLFLSLRNIGEQPAVGVNVRFDRPLSGVEGTKEVSALPVFRRLAFLGPGREIRVFLDSSASYFSRRQPTRLAVEIGYRDRDGHRYETTIKHDLSVYRELGYVSPTLDTERR
jgi:hypothetical protein